MVETGSVFCSELGSGFQVCSGNAVIYLSEVKTSTEVVPRYNIVLHDIFVMGDF